MTSTRAGKGKVAVTRIIGRLSIAVAALGYGAGAHSQTTAEKTRGLPDPPSMAGSSPAAGIGPSPGALAPSEFTVQATGLIGGRGRGGAGRIPRKLISTNPAPSGTSFKSPGEFNLPSALPDGGQSAGSEGASPGSIADEEGVPDGMSLDEALERLLSANLDLLALKYEIPQADADILTAGLIANPLLYGDTQFIPYGKYSGARPLGPTEYDVSITHPIDISHKRKSRLRVARAAKSTVEAQFQDAARRQIGNLQKAYVDLQSARVDVLTGEAALKSLRKSLDQVGRRDGNPVELDRIEKRMEKTADSLNEARDSLEDARETVGLLLNLPVEAAARLQPRGRLRVQAPPPPPLEELTPLALGNRPDLIAARRGIGRAEGEIKLAKSNKFDDIFLFYDPLTYQDNRNSRQPSGRSWSVGLTVPLPIYNRNQGNIARAASNLTQTRIETAALERRIISEVRLAEREYRGSRQALERSEGVIRTRSRQDRARAAAEYAAGSIRLDEYLDRLEDDNEVAHAYRDALVRHRRAMLDLNTVLGVRLLP